MRLTVLTLILIASLAPAPSAATIRVPAQQPTIQAGINAATIHDTVLVASGTYIENLNFNGKRIKVISEFGSRATLLKPSTASDIIVRIVNAEDTSTLLSGFTIEGGTGSSAIRINGASPVITKNIIKGYRGGTNSVAVSCDNGNALISRNVFYDNGGISCIGIWTGTARIINNTFDQNARGFFTISGSGEARNNVVTNSTEYGIAGTFTALQYNDVWNNNPNYTSGAAAGIGSLASDPLYLDVANRDYRLSPTSPCVNTGDPSPIYNDLDGTRNDMGASPGGGEGYPLPLSISLGPTCGSTRVKSLTPLISWQYADIGNTTQQSYEIQVGTDQNWTTAEMWASGTVVDRQNNVPYQGYSLSDRTRYYLRMRVNNGTKWGSWVETSFLVWVSSRIEVPTAYAGIQAAINAACTGDTIVVSPGTYIENVLVSGKSVVILGNGGPNTVALLPAVNNLPCIQFANCPDTMAELRNFTLLPANASAAVLLTGTGRPIIRSCIFRGYLAADVVIRCEVTNALITRNVFYDNMGISCVGIYSGSARIVNNTFDSNNRGLFSVSGQGDVRNNSITNSREYGISGNFAKLEYNNVWFNTPNYQSPAVPGLGSISLDPWYSDRPARDYHLQSRSPCLNSGDPATQYADPDGSRNDIGAFVGNQAPVLGTIGPKTVAEGATLSFGVSGFDPDGTNPTLSTSALPPNASFTDNLNGTGTFAFAPNYTQSGTYNVTFRTSDGAEIDTEVVVITVTNTNRPPVLAAIGAKSIYEGQLLTFGISATDPDGDTPTLAASALPPNATLIDNHNGTGAFNFTPSYSQAGKYNVIFVTSDGAAADSEIVVVTVINVNQPPELAAIGSQSGNEAELLSFTVTAADPDGTTPTLSTSPLPSGATFTDQGNGTGTFNFTPSFTQSGLYNVTFRAWDGEAIDTEIVDITIRNVARPAVLVSIHVDGSASPQHLVNHSPYIQWQYTDPEAVGQTSFEIAIGNDPDWQVAEMWSTTEVTSDTFATYSGLPMADGQTYYLRLRIYTDQVWSNWYETSFHTNAAPSVPVPRSPISQEVTGNTPTLWILNATDTEGDPLLYEFSGLHDSDCVTGSSINLTGIVGGQDSTGGQITSVLAENCRYSWRVRAFDGLEYSDWSSYAQFWVNGVPEPPTNPLLQAPLSGSLTPLFSLQPTLQWSNSSDPDPLDTIQYRLEMSLMPNFSFVNIIDSLSAPEWTAPDSLQFGTHYWWRVTAKDRSGLSAMSSIGDFWTWRLGDVNHSHVTDLTDLSIMVSYLLRSGGTISPKKVGDVTGDCRIDLVDLSTLVSYLNNAGGRFRVGCE